MTATPPAIRLHEAGQQNRLYSKLDEDGRFLFPFRVCSFGERMYDEAELEELENEPLPGKKQSLERNGTDGTSISDLVKRWAKMPLKRFLEQPDAWPAEAETAVPGHPCQVVLCIEKMHFAKQELWNFQLSVSTDGPESRTKGARALRMGSKEEVLDYLRKRIAFGSGLPIDYLCESVSMKEDKYDPMEDWWVEICDTPLYVMEERHMGQPNRLFLAQSANDEWIKCIGRGNTEWKRKRTLWRWAAASTRQPLRT